MPVYWLAGKDYDNAPVKEHNKPKLGTDPPIEPWTSPWIGSKVEDVAEWLREKPDSVDLDSNHFAVLDARAVDKSIVLCKIGDRKLRGDSLSLTRHLARSSSNFLMGMDPGNWEEQFEGVGGEKNHAEIDYGDSK